MIKNILQIPIFVLVTISYYFIFKSVFGLPFFIYGRLLGLWHKFRHREHSPQLLAFLTRLEAVGIFLFSFTFLCCFFYFNLQDAGWLKIWETPLLISLFFFVSVHQAASSGSYHPLLSAIGRVILLASWPIIILIVIGLLFPEYILPRPFEWAIALAAFLILPAGARTFRRHANEMQSFDVLDKRHDNLGNSLRRLQHIADIIGDAENWRSIREALSNMDDLYNQTLTALRRNQLLEADRLIVKAEMEVVHIERTFKNRIQLSLRDELGARIKQGVIDIENLKHEFEIAGLSAGNLNQLSDHIASLLPELDKLDLSGDDLLKDLDERLKLFEQPFREIIDTRTALRFRQSIDATSFSSNIEKRWLLSQVAKDLGLYTKQAEEQKEEVESKLQAFQSNPINNSNDLVDAYQALNKSLTEYRESIALLEAEIMHNWNVENLDSGSVSLYAPKVSSTSHEIRGVVSAYFDDPNRQNLSFELDSALLELQSSHTVTVEPIPGKTYGSSPFSLSGKRSGQAILTITVKESQSARRTFTIRINPSISDVAKEALIFGAPIGAVAGFAAWYFFKSDSKDATTIGAAFGGAFGLLVFIINYLRYKRSF